MQALPVGAHGPASDETAVRPVHVHAVGYPDRKGIGTPFARYGKFVRLYFRSDNRIELPSRYAEFPRLDAAVTRYGNGLREHRSEDVIEKPDIGRSHLNDPALLAGYFVAVFEVLEFFPILDTNGQGH